MDGEPVIWRVGAAEVLAACRRDGDQLVVEVAEVVGGGDGTLLALRAELRRWSAQQGVAEIQWVVHAVECAKPNERLRAVLARRGFVVGVQDGVEAYRWRDRVDRAVSITESEKGDGPRPSPFF